MIVIEHDTVTTRDMVQIQVLNFYHNTCLCTIKQLKEGVIKNVNENVLE